MKDKSKNLKCLLLQFLFGALRVKSEKVDFSVHMYYSIELFQSTCDELVEWIKEKDNVLSATDDLGKDLLANQALQRKHAVRSLYSLHNE